MLASVVAVVASCIFPQTIKLSEAAEADLVPTGVGEVLSNLVTNMVANPLVSIVDGNYMGILFWAVLLVFLYMSIKYYFT